MFPWYLHLQQDIVGFRGFDIGDLLLDEEVADNAVLEVDHKAECTGMKKAVEHRAGC